MINPNKKRERIIFSLKKIELMDIQQPLKREKMGIRESIINGLVKNVIVILKD